MNDDYVMVPRVPTREMKIAGQLGITTSAAAAIYRAMFAAAPRTAQQPVAWMDSLLGDVSLPSEHTGDPSENGYIPLYRL